MAVAVLDIGKTNRKVLVFGGAGEVLAERSEPNGPLPPDATCPYLRLDTEAVWTFLLRSLKELAQLYQIEALSIIAHGGAGVLVADDGVALPPMDYETTALEAERAEYDSIRPPFEETLSPITAGGLNVGRQIYYLMRHFPDDAKRATAFLCYPQYWAWRLSGVMASETTSLGCHGDLWRPHERRLSSLIEKMHWEYLFPPLRKAWDSLGPIKAEIAEQTGLRPDTLVHCGAHDSNAAIVPYLVGRSEPFTVISTGTWVILLAVGGKGALDPDADMLANVDVFGRPVPCARLMGGREFAVLAGDKPATVDAADIADIVAAGVQALPAFSDRGGPFAGRLGRIVGREPTTPKERTALATLYSALMTEYMLERLEAPGEWIVEGGFAKTPAFASVLAALAPARRVVLPTTPSGAAEGAAMLARWDALKQPTATTVVAPWAIPGLAEYRARWRAAL